jgi:hypothetical protein
MPGTTLKNYTYVTPASGPVNDTTTWHTSFYCKEPTIDASLKHSNLHHFMRKGTHRKPIFGSLVRSVKAASILPAA